MKLERFFISLELILRRVIMSKKQCFPSVIIFFGPDSTGKSTQAKLLIKYLKSKQCRVAWTWIRGSHSIAFVLSKFLARQGYYRTVKVPSGVVYRVFDPHLLPGLKPLWGLIEFVSVLPWIILRVYLRRILGYTVVAERYVVDTVVYLAYWLDSDFLKSLLAKVLLGFIPRGSVLIHLDAESRVLIERLKKVRYDIATSDYITFQQRAYHVLSQSLNAVTIDTSKFNVEETFQLVINALSLQ